MGASNASAAPATAPRSRERRFQRRVHVGRRDDGERARAFPHGPHLVDGPLADPARRREHEARLLAGAAHGLRRLDRGRRDREQPGGDLHDFGRGPVVHRQGDELRRVVRRDVREHVVPGGERTGPAGLAGIADERHRPRRAAAGEHPPLHGGQVLRFVDEHVPERAQFGGSLADLTRAVAVALGERRGVGETVQPEIFDHARRGVDRVLGPAPAPATRASGLDRTEDLVTFDEPLREMLLQTEDLEWVEKSLAGLSHKMLWRDPETEASIALVRFEQGLGDPVGAQARVEPVHVLPVRPVRVPADRDDADQGQLLLEPQGRARTDRRWPRRPPSCWRCTTGRTTRSGRSSTTTTRTPADMAGWDVHTHLIPPTVLSAAHRGEFGLSIDSGSLVVDGQRLPLGRLADPAALLQWIADQDAGRRCGVRSARAVPVRRRRRVGRAGEPGASGARHTSAARPRRSCHCSIRPHRRWLPVWPVKASSAASNTN